MVVEIGVFQTKSATGSTSMGDRLEIPGAVDIFASHTMAYIIIEST